MKFHRPNILNGKSLSKWKAPLFVLPALLFLVGLDILSDFLFGSTAEHLMVEIVIQGLIIITAAFSLVSMWLKYVREREQRLIKSNELQQALHKHQLQNRQASFSKLFRHHVEEEFTRWQLTPSEKQVALLLLDGEDFKSIAQQRFTSEKTVRNQSRSIYEKAGLSGRANLAGHFLKTLLHAEMNQGDEFSASSFLTKNESEFLSNVHRDHVKTTVLASPKNHSN